MAELSNDWHPEDIKAEVRKRGSSLAALARAAGVSTQALSLTLQARVSERCERVIADFLKIHPQQIWPTRYRSDGSRLGTRKASVAA